MFVIDVVLAGSVRSCRNGRVVFSFVRPEQQQEKEMTDQSSNRRSR